MKRIIKLSVAQRDAIRAVELDEFYIQWGIRDAKSMLLKKKGLRDLTHLCLLFCESKPKVGTQEHHLVLVNTELPGLWLKSRQEKVKIW
jgi:hypothetical protein